MHLTEATLIVPNKRSSKAKAKNFAVVIFLFSLLCFRRMAKQKTDNDDLDDDNDDNDLRGDEEQEEFPFSIFRSPLTVTSATVTCAHQRYEWKRLILLWKRRRSVEGMQQFAKSFLVCFWWLTQWMSSNAGSKPVKPLRMLNYLFTATLSAPRRWVFTKRPERNAKSLEASAVWRLWVVLTRIAHACGEVEKLGKFSLTRVEGRKFFRFRLTFYFSLSLEPDKNGEYWGNIVFLINLSWSRDWSASRVCRVLRTHSAPSLWQKRTRRTFPSLRFSVILSFCFTTSSTSTS